MTDRELLEAAARAAGYVVRWYDDTLTHGPTFGIEVEPGNPCGFDTWNPLTDDGDALRLAVKLGLRISTDNGSLDRKMTEVLQGYGFWSAENGRAELHGNDPMGATRRAIVRAAAEIGRAMK